MNNRKEVGEWEGGTVDSMHAFDSVCVCVCVMWVHMIMVKMISSGNILRLVCVCMLEWKSQSQTRRCNFTADFTHDMHTLSAALIFSVTALQSFQVYKIHTFTIPPMTHWWLPLPHYEVIIKHQEYITEQLGPKTKKQPYNTQNDHRESKWSQKGTHKIRYIEETK